MSPRTLAATAALPLLGLAIGIFAAVNPLRTEAAASPNIPAYDKNGNLLPLADYRQWTYLTSGIDMSYTAPKTAANGQPPTGQSKFDNVFVDPAAWRSFQQTGTWPDKTTMVLEVRSAKGRGSINLTGHYQGTEILDLEVHVKDEARFPGKWAFFEFDSQGANGKLLPQSAACYTCHAAHGAVDTTFVQFYPTLLPVAQKKGTLSQAFQNENADSTAVR